MTSTNIVEHTIKNESKKVVASHRHNIMCKRDTRKLMLLENPDKLWIYPWGYD